MSKKELTEAFEKVFEACADVDTDDFCAALDGLLDDLLEEDFFGTEGQCDPRQDWRNK
jgi:hypothetical protein